MRVARLSEVAEMDEILSDPSARIALIAGSGRLPVSVASGLVEAGKPPFVIIVKGERVERSELTLFEHDNVAIEEMGRLIPLLREKKITHLIMAGGVSVRPRLRDVKWSLGLLGFLRRYLHALALGDNALLKSVVDHIEANGVRVVGAHEILPDLLANPGPMTRTKPQSSDQRDIDAAREAALAIGRLDIGQAAVSVGGRVIALEGIEGTDGLLQRVRGLRDHGRVSGIGRGVLVKFSKPGQELRADLPTIGPATIDAAHAAGLAGIAVETERTFVLDFARTIERADELGLFLVGLPQAE